MVRLALENYLPDWPKKGDPDWLSDGKPAGVVMYNKAHSDVAEFHRMFVSTAARGHRLGRKMLEAMFEQMVTGGYTRVFFSSVTFLTHAREMYRNAGFVDTPNHDGFPITWQERVYSMERLLP